MWLCAGYRGEACGELRAECGRRAAARALLHLAIIKIIGIGNLFLFAKTDQETKMFVKNQLFSPGAEGAIVQRSSVCWVARVAELGPGTSEIYVDQCKLINSFPLNIADTTVANKNLLRYRSC